MTAFLKELLAGAAGADWRIRVHILPKDMDHSKLDKTDIQCNLIYGANGTIQFSFVNGAHWFRGQKNME